MRWRSGRAALDGPAAPTEFTYPAQFSPGDVMPLVDADGAVAAPHVAREPRLRGYVS